MATIDIDELLRPFSLESPAGRDCSDDDVRMEINFAMDVDPAGNSGPGKVTKPIDWQAVTAQILELSRRTKDVALAAYLCRAGAQGRSLETVHLGAKYLNGLLTQYWDTAYPTVPRGVGARRSYIEALASPGSFLIGLLDSPLVELPRSGRCTVEDLERISGDQADARKAAAIAEIAPRVTKLYEIKNMLLSIDQELISAHAGFVAGAGGKEKAPNLQPAHQALARMLGAIEKFLPDQDSPMAQQGLRDLAGQPDTAAIPKLAPSAPSPEPSTHASASAAEECVVRSRSDVVRVIDAVCAYYREAEPGHPVPDLLRRARTWVHLDFLTILQDIAPSALSEAKVVLHLRADEQKP